MNRATTLDPITYKIKQFGYRKVFKFALKNSLQILVPSNFVKKGLIEEWKINSSKIHVTYEAVDEKLLSISSKISKEKAKGILKQFNIRSQFIFYVGNAHPHKNIEGLIKAFTKLRQKYQYLQLVLAGADHYFWENIKKQNPNKDIIFTGKVSDEQLGVLYSNARCFVLPSFEEGFGIPILEAMALNCPVISSNAGSLMEVGAEAALYFNPTSQVEFVEIIDKVLKNNNLRSQMVKKGIQRYKKFSWEKLTRETLGVYLKCV